MKELIEKYGQNGSFFIAEIGNNHSGCLKTAKELVDAAKQAGASAAKFQKRNNKKLMQSVMSNKEYNSNNSFGKTYLEHREIVELSIEDFKELKKYCEKKEILFFATPFDESSLAELIDIDSELYKIASADIVHTDLIEAVASTGKPVILSTGGASIKEIDNAVEIIERHGNPYSILQCTAAYPCDASEMNLNVISSFKERYPNATIGLSDHQSGISMALIAYMLGARVFEKHFTLHRSWKGTDQSFSLEPGGLRRMIRDITSIDGALGSREKAPLPVEKDAMFKMRKSIVLSKDLKAGDIISRDSVEFKCPGNGISVDKLSSLLGKKINKDLPSEYVLTQADFK